MNRIMPLCYAPPSAIMPTVCCGADRSHEWQPPLWPLISLQHSPSQAESGPRAMPRRSWADTSILGLPRPPAMMLPLSAPDRACAFSEASLLYSCLQQLQKGPAPNRCRLTCHFVICPRWPSCWVTCPVHPRNDIASRVMSCHVMPCNVM